MVKSFAEFKLVKNLINSFSDREFDPNCEKVMQKSARKKAAISALERTNNNQAIKELGGSLHAARKKRLNIKLGHSPLSTCTVMDLGCALLGLHVYLPESLGLACCTNRKLVVLSPFSVTTETPPLDES